MTDYELARLRFDCFMQAQQFSRPAPLPDDGSALGFQPRQGIGVDEALEIAGKIEAWCVRERERVPFDFDALGKLRERGAGY